jgi:hypothetical protein
MRPYLKNNKSKKGSWSSSSGRALMPWFNPQLAGEKTGRGEGGGGEGRERKEERGEGRERRENRVKTHQFKSRAEGLEVWLMRYSAALQE